jgi:hypothetical protein
MLLAALIAASLIVSAATDAGASWAPLNESAGAHLRHMSTQQKRAVVRPLVNSANECIARKVSANPRFPTLAHAGDVNELIVESVPSCLDAVRAMIDAHDRLFGEGAGDSFFMGPYLDALPSAVQELVTGAH